MGSCAARARPARKVSDSISRWMPRLKADRAAGLANTLPSAVLKPMNWRDGVGTVTISACPAEAGMDTVGSALMSAVWWEVKR